MISLLPEELGMVVSLLDGLQGEGPRGGASTDGSSRASRVSRSSGTSSSRYSGKKKEHRLFDFSV